MAFQKYGDNEKINPLEEEEENIIEQHIAKTGKAIEDLDDDEREELWEDLDNVD